MAEFEWTSDTRVVIYGAAGMGTLIHRYLSEFSNVVAFLDKRAGEISSHLGLPVHRLEEAPFAEESRQDCLVVLAVKNVYEHEEIAASLRKHGFEHILYFPASAVRGRPESETQKQMGEMFIALRDKKITLPRKLPEARLALQHIWSDYAVIREEGENTVVNIPSLFIHTNSYPDGYSNAWHDIPLLGMFTHIEFFRHCAGDAGASAQAYIDHYASYTAASIGDFSITDGWKDNVLRNRSMVYKEMDNFWNLDRDFFIRKAPRAEWNESGYFNLLNGKHRSTFLVSKGHEFIPLRVRTEDYKKFINTGALEELKRYVADKGVNELDFNVIHPQFYMYRSRLVTGIFQAVKNTALFFAKELFRQHGRVDFTKLRVYSAAPDFEQFALYLRLLGAEVTPGGRPSEFTELVSGLYHLKDAETPDERSDEPYDLAICDLTRPELRLEAVRNCSYRLFIFDDEAALDHALADARLLPCGEAASVFCDGKKLRLALAARADRPKA